MAKKTAEESENVKIAGEMECNTYGGGLYPFSNNIKWNLNFLTTLKQKLVLSQKMRFFNTHCDGELKSHFLQPFQPC